MDISSLNPGKEYSRAEETGCQAGKWGFDLNFERREETEEGQERR